MKPSFFFRWLTPLFVCLSIIVALRLLLPRPYMVSYDHLPGLDMFIWNLKGGRGYTYANVWATVGVLPLVPLIAWKRLPTELRVFTVLMLIYLGSVLWGGALEETRLLLLPLALVMLPSLLYIRRRRIPA